MRWALLFFLALPVWADDAELNTIHVTPADEGPLKRHEIIKTEVIRRRALEHKRASTLADAVSGQVGVDTQNSCAHCGSKRVTINGMRGEHTTVLIDGMPMHSAISSFYGMDAVPVVGIESIEVSRGAGASLVAPEAIGGVLNIITVRPKETGIALDGNIGTQKTGFASILGSVVGADGKRTLMLAGQLSHAGSWDVDANRISEAPDLGNQSIFVKGSTDLGESDRVEARYALQTVDILGGTVDGSRVSSYQTPPANQNGLFESDDVSKPYLGTQAAIVDSVALTRHEGMARWNHFFSSDLQLQLSSSLAHQSQNAIYMHGYDYRNRDLLWFNDLRTLFSIGDDHFLTVGLELRNQDMTSESQKLYIDTTPALAPDSFDYRSRAAYLQDVWVISDDFEASAALRVDSMRVNFLAQTAAEYEISQTMLAPRVHLKWRHHPHLTSRLMYGRGYRPPLSFFESQHGLNEYGFVMQVTDIEKSHSLGYSMAVEYPNLTITGSTHHTWISNLAHAEEAAVEGDPASFVNFPGTLRVWANDIVISYSLLPNWNLQLSYENFTMDAAYKRLLPAAAVEQRVRLVSDFHYGNWEFVNTVTWIGPRNLSEYGYDEHFRTIADYALDPDVPNLTGWQVLDPKRQQAPGYFTWDVYLGWTLRQKYTFYASVQNVLNYTQVASGDSPLTWASHGGEKSHFHLDNNHTWGPLRGRTFGIGFRAQL